MSSNTTACFNCILPGLNKPDIWQVNGKELNANVNQAGSLIVTNPSEIFGSDMTTSILTCGKRSTNASITAIIFYKGKSNVRSDAYTCSKCNYIKPFFVIFTIAVLTPESKKSLDPF